jgi:hypothetical protein
MSATMSPTMFFTMLFKQPIANWFGDDDDENASCGRGGYN